MMLTGLSIQLGEHQKESDLLLMKRPESSDDSYNELVISRKRKLPGFEQNANKRGRLRTDDEIDGGSNVELMYEQRELKTDVLKGQDDAINFRREIYLNRAETEYLQDQYKQLLQEHAQTTDEVEKWRSLTHQADNALQEAKKQAEVNGIKVKTEPGVADGSEASSHSAPQVPADPAQAVAHFQRRLESKSQQLAETNGQLRTAEEKLRAEQSKTAERDAELKQLRETLDAYKRHNHVLVGRIEAVQQSANATAAAQIVVDDSLREIWPELRIRRHAAEAAQHQFLELKRKLEIMGEDTTLASSDGPVGALEAPVSSSDSEESSPRGTKQGQSGVKPMDIKTTASSSSNNGNSIGRTAMQTGPETPNSNNNNSNSGQKTDMNSSAAAKPTSQQQVAALPTASPPSSGSSGDRSGSPVPMDDGSDENSNDGETTGESAVAATASGATGGVKAKAKGKAPAKAKRGSRGSKPKRR